MGNNTSSLNLQPSKEGMCERGFPPNKKHPLRGPFFIETTEPINGIHNFQLYRIGKDGIYTAIFSFQTHDYLKNVYNFFYDGKFFKFVFETDSLNTEVIHSIEYSILFSEPVQSETELWNSLSSMSSLVHKDRQIFHLTGNYWYYQISVCANLYEFYIVESSDETRCGFDSTFKSGDTVFVISKIDVKSSNVPFVMNDYNGNFVIASGDQGFVPIPIDLPNDVLTLAQALSQKTSQ